METRNERREDSDMRRLFDAIAKVGQDCNDQHIETQKTLSEMSRAHTVFHTKLSAVEETLGRVGTKVDVATERAAATGAIVDTLRGQNKEQYDRLSNIEGDIKVLTGKVPEPTKSVDSQSSQGGSMSDGTIKILAGTAIFALVCILIAFGAMTVSDAKELVK